jgi:hypothetical protein
MKSTKKYDEYQLGFDRTQLWKEYESPMIRRQSALNAAQSFFGNNDIDYSPIELKALYKNFLNLIETGDDSFFERFQEHLNKKK